MIGFWISDNDQLSLIRNESMANSKKKKSQKKEGEADEKLGDICMCACERACGFRLKAIPVELVFVPFPNRDSNHRNELLRFKRLLSLQTHIDTLAHHIYCAFQRSKIFIRYGN